MNPYLRTFLHRGLIFSGLGPILAGIIYVILELSGVDLNLSGLDVLKAILTTYVMAFIHAGSGVFNEIEKWGKAKAILCQMSSIYIVYMGGYLINNWIPLDYRIILIFTGSFIVGYLVIWFMVYFITKKNTEKLNEKLKLEQELDK